MFNVMPFLKIRGMFPLLYENYAHDNHKGSGKKCSPKVLWHLKEADLSHSLGWHGMVLGSLPAGYVSMSCYLFMSKKPHAGERPALSIIINHPAQGSSRSRTFRWNVIFRLQGGTQYLGLKRSFLGCWALTCCLHEPNMSGSSKRLPFSWCPTWEVLFKYGEQNVSALLVCLRFPNASAINWWDDCFIDTLIIFPQSFFVDTKSIEKLIR